MLDVLAHVWAKSARSGADDGEHLTGHTANVLARLASWRDRYPALPSHTNLPEALWSLAAWACLLHDVGKVALGFQRMLRGGPAFHHRHEVLSLVAVGWLDLPERHRELLAAGVATHHYDLPVILDERYPYASDARANLLAELSPEDRGALRSWMSGAGAPDVGRWGFASLPSLRPMAPEQALAEAMRALAALRDRLERCDATHPDALAARVMRGLVTLADHAGSAHERHGRVPTLESTQGLTKHLERRCDWSFFWPHQRACAELDGHAVLIAPTGSGKTEAALLWAARQRERGPGRPAIFYVLPYRASLNAMRVRLSEKYGVPDGAVVLQHAKATADLYTRLTSEKSYTRDRALKEARHERNLGRLMTAPARVLTPYQLLRAFFGLRGHEAVLTDAAGGLFVLDELHAYDVARLSLILAAVRHLSRDLGARFLAMSATFPDVLKAAWVDVLGTEPLEVHADRATQDQFRRHVLRVLDAALTADSTLEEIVARFRRNEAVLVVATTVARAQTLFDALRARVGDEAVWLLHGRFTAGDRAEKEQLLAARVGTDAREEGASGTILVATQVVEVSLDVDFDVLFTDPAPIEALIQRFGRVNRARRGPLRDVYVCGAAPDEAGRVYDAADVQRAIAILGPFDGSVIEEANVRGWVDAAYEPIANAWLAEVRRQVESRLDGVVRTNTPLRSHPELEKAFDELFDGSEVVPELHEAEYRQRLGDEPLAAVLLRVPISNGQWHALRRAGRLDGEIARVPYDSTRGLNLTFRDDDA